MKMHPFRMLIAISCFFAMLPGFAQKESYSRADSLLGTLTPLRSCYDVYFYDLSLRILPESKSIAGSNTIYFTATETFKEMQIDLAANLAIRRIEWQGNALSFDREHQAVYVRFPKRIKAGTQSSITVYYEGKPREAKQAPWDGGFVWKTYKDKPWIGVACEGNGAHIWIPNKDHLSDEPDSVRLHYEVPEGLMAVGNGQFAGSDTLHDGFVRFHWRVTYPINNYNITLYVAPYVHRQDEYTSEDGQKLRLDYFVLPGNEEKSKKQFAQVKPMLRCYEKYFGKYPFWRDGYKLVEAPYLGMEHQSAIAYGNGYQNGYRGYSLSKASHIGERFDFIIIHESGHEYWGNLLSCDDHADMWLHESWCTYSEALYVECMWGKDAGDAYLAGYRPLIANQEPMLAPRGVHADPPGDIYFKGALMLQTLRHVVANDKLWFRAIRAVLEEFGYKTVDTPTFIRFFSQQLNQDYTLFFKQYLEHKDIPVFEYRVLRGKLHYRWKADVPGFEMPFVVSWPGETRRLQVTTRWQSLPLPHQVKKEDLIFDTFHFLVDVRETYED